MMILSRYQQQQVQKRLFYMSQEDRLAEVDAAIDVLSAVATAFHHGASLDREMETQAALAIEFICRYESMVEGRGWLFRSRRRVQIFRKFFKPV